MSYSRLDGHHHHHHHDHHDQVYYQPVSSPYIANSMYAPANPRPVVIVAAPEHCHDDEIHCCCTIV